MLKNYIKITFKVLARNKFFTFISLFGISFTLLILMLVAAFWNNSFGYYGVEKDFDRTFVVDQLHFKNDEEGSDSQSEPSFYFMEEYMGTLKSPERIGGASNTSLVNVYVGDQGLKLDMKATDANYWEILHFNFLAGRAFDEQEIRQNSRLAVINEKTARELFGSTDCIGKRLKYSRYNYEVIGVVQNVSSSRIFSSADLYIPMTPFLQKQEANQSMTGGITIFVQMPDASQLNKGIQEYAGIVENFKMPPSMSDYNYLVSAGFKPHESVLGRFTKLEAEQQPYFYLAATVIMLLFMLLPAINLVNINISRMMERSSEIGVRKAFGASTGHLVGQFVIENILITLVGGLIGLMLTFPVMQGVNASEFIPGLKLSMNLSLFGQALLLILAFGLMSGVYPAYKMSKLQIVKALNTDQN